MVTKSDKKKIVFLNVDIEKSTEYKYRKNPEHWRELFIVFYKEFPKFLHRQFTDTNQAIPRYWKGLGDSQIFTCNFITAEDLQLYAVNFYRAVNEFDHYLVDMFNTRVKASAWFASFPTLNLEIKTPNGFDYIGPDIDIGFRVANASMGGRMVIAMDMAYELSLSCNPASGTFYHTSWQKLKGVFKNKPYPILEFSSGRRPHIPVWEEYLIGSKENFFEAHRISPEELRHLIDRYKKELGHKPYLV